MSAEASGLSVPLDDFILSRLDIQTIEYAEDLLTRACMRGSGFDWEMLPPPARTDTDPLHRRRYGVIEPEVAGRYGYHLPPLAPDQQAREQVWRRRDALPPPSGAPRTGTTGRAAAGTPRARGWLRASPSSTSSGSTASSATPSRRPSGFPPSSRCSARGAGA
ncbi:hypothetical protein ACFQYP_17550 [Nonomuraea antimicrobica]